MYDGSIVEHGGEVYKKVDGKWMLLSSDSGDWFPDEWIYAREIKVIKNVDPLDGLVPGTIMTSPDGFEAAVYEGDGMWTRTESIDWYPTVRILQYFGEGWKIVYRPGENNE